MMNISDSTSGRVTHIIVLVFWGDGKGRSIDFSIRSMKQEQAFLVLCVEDYFLSAVVKESFSVSF